MTWMDVVCKLVSKNAQASELQAETNTLSETLLQLLQAPAGVSLWRKSLLVSCRVTINRTESLSFFLQETVLQEGASLSASAHTHTQTHWDTGVFAELCVTVIYVHVPTLCVSIPELSRSSLWASNSESLLSVSTHFTIMPIHFCFLALSKFSRENTLSVVRHHNTQRFDLINS